VHCMLWGLREVVRRLSETSSEGYSQGRGGCRRKLKMKVGGRLYM
jgi:hypothetical protein